MPKTVTRKSKRRTTKKPVVKAKPASRVATAPRAREIPGIKAVPIPGISDGEAVTRTRGVSIPVLGTDGKPTGKMTLPAELFAAKINKTLLAQAVRVYLANQRQGSAATKTRGKVEGSTRKIYRQKGTGRARHGAIRAPIFVGGGIVFGPTPRDYHLDLPKKMKRAALASALTDAFQNGKIIVVDGLSGLAPKTKIMGKAFSDVGVRESILLVVSKGAHGVVRAARNIADVDILPAQNLYAYSVLMHQKVVFMKEAIDLLKETFTK